MLGKLATIARGITNKRKNKRSYKGRLVSKNSFLRSEYLIYIIQIDYGLSATTYLNLNQV